MKPLRLGDYEETFEARGHLYNRAMARFPAARERERALLIERLRLRGDERCCDAPAGGGYVANGLRQKLLASAPAIACVEPSARFAQGIPKEHERHTRPLDDSGLAASSIDALASLAGLHHLEDRLRIYRAWAYVLRPGARIAIADVQSDTGPARFLNGFVDAHNSQGHRGVFIEEGE